MKQSKPIRRGNAMLFVLFMSLNLCGQNSSIYGKATFEQSLIPIDSLKIELLDSINNVAKTVFTNENGIYKLDDLSPGNYELFISKNKMHPQLITKIQLNHLEDLEINLETLELCENQYNTKYCPYCESKNKVLTISPGLIVLYNFGDDEVAADKFERKIRRKGYETFINEDNEEVVISMYIESEQGKFWDLCHSWFCRKCKKVF